MEMLGWPVVIFDQNYSIRDQNANSGKKVM
jgi:hypothetical protein